MGENISNNKKGTIFMDIDGTLVKHNYDPENIPDEFLPGSLAWLKSMVANNFTVILTTSRHPLLALKVRKMLEVEGIFASAICMLGTGGRILVNDYKEVGEIKAQAILVKRDEGIQYDPFED